MEMSGQFHAPASLSPRKQPPSTHCIGGWLGPRAYLEAMEREKSFAPTENRTLNAGSPYS
jgi:hypothetical protein